MQNLTGGGGGVEKRNTFNPETPPSSSHCDRQAALLPSRREGCPRHSGNFPRGRCPPAPRAPARTGAAAPRCPGPGARRRRPGGGPSCGTGGWLCGRHFSAGRAPERLRGAGGPSPRSRPGASPRSRRLTPLRHGSGRDPRPAAAQRPGRLPPPPAAPRLGSAALPRRPAFAGGDAESRRAAAPPPSPRGRQPGPRRARGGGGGGEARGERTSAPPLRSAHRYLAGRESGGPRELRPSRAARQDQAGRSGVE